MINGYKLKNDTLYLYLDINYEFSLFDSSNNNNLYYQIKKYINNLKDKINYKKIVLVINGVMLTSLVLNNIATLPSYNINLYKDNYNNITLVKENDIKLVSNYNSKTKISYKLNYNKVTLNIKKVKDAVGYRIYRSYDNKTYKFIGSTKSLSYTDTKLKINQTYYYKVKAYKIVKGEKVYSLNSNIVKVTPKLDKVGFKIEKVNNNTINIKINKVKNAVGYQIYRSSSKDKGYSLIKTTKSLNYQDTKLKQNKTYYYKIRPYVLVKGKKVYGSFSLGSYNIKTPIVTIYRSNGSILKIELENYLVGVVAAEMPASFDIEALKAQAVVARTYALKKIEEGVKLTDTTETQCYIDNVKMKSMWKDDYNFYYNKVKEAVSKTAGITIKYQNKYIDALYFSTSNGYTEDASNVWGNDIPYLKSVDSLWDKDVAGYQKQVTISFKDVLKKTGVKLTNESVVKVLKRNESNRVSEVLLGDKVFTGNKLRSLLGLRSSDFDIVVKKDNIVITTKGYGHGVGMSQYGAHMMALKGYNYKNIINHYYTGVSISK